MLVVAVAVAHRPAVPIVVALVRAEGAIAVRVDAVAALVGPRMDGRVLVVAVAVVVDVSGRGRIAGSDHLVSGIAVPIRVSIPMVGTVLDTGVVVARIVVARIVVVSGVVVRVGRVFAVGGVVSHHVGVFWTSRQQRRDSERSDS